MTDLKQDLAALRIEREPERPGVGRWIGWAVVLLMLAAAAGGAWTWFTRERPIEVSVATVGFSNGLVLMLVLAESLFTALPGGGIALALAWVFITRGSLNSAFLPVFLLRGRDVMIGVVLCFLLGSLAGALPAAAAMRLRVTDALRRN